MVELHYSCSILGQTNHQGDLEIRYKINYVVQTENFFPAPKIQLFTLSKCEECLYLNFEIFDKLPEVQRKYNLLFFPALSK